MTPKDLEDTLTIIATKAKALRESGITGRVCIGDVQFDLTPAEPSVRLSDEPGEPDPLNDGATFGGEIPRRRGASYATEDDEE